MYISLAISDLKPLLHYSINNNKENGNTYIFTIFLVTTQAQELGVSKAGTMDK